MIKFNDFVVRERGCAMFKIPFSLDSLSSSIDLEDLHENGIEVFPHITVLYGFFSFVNPIDVIRVAKDFKPPKVEFGGIGLFNTPQFDVLKIDIFSEDLQKMHESLWEFPHDNDKDFYVPHVTIAYLKNGTGTKYSKKTSGFEGEMNLYEFVYSSADDVKHNLILNG